MPAEISPSLSAYVHGSATDWSSPQHADFPLFAHPRFDEAMITAAKSFVSFYSGNWLLNRIANDRGRVVASFVMLDLYFSGGMSGFTVAQLREEAKNHAVCSPNRMTALAALLRVGGFLQVVPAKDSRMRKLAPTEAMFKLHRDRLTGTLAASAMINPDLAAVVPMLGENEVLGDIAHSYVGFWRGGLRATGGKPALETFAERDAGFTILWLLLSGIAEGRSYRVSDLSRHFAISRTHALEIMRTGMEFGLIAQNGEGGPYMGTQALLQAMRPVFLTLFQIQTEAVRYALRQRAARTAAAR